GGLAGRINANGYTFDSGPTVLTMPEILDECFAAVGASMADHVQLERVDPMYRACYADGTDIKVRQGTSAMVEEIRRTCSGKDADSFLRFAGWLKELYQLEMPNFIDRNLPSVFSLVKPIGPALALIRSGAFRRLEPAVRRYFDDERLVRLFSFQAL